MAKRSKALELIMFGKQAVLNWNPQKLFLNKSFSQQDSYTKEKCQNSCSESCRNYSHWQTEDCKIYENIECTTATVTNYHIVGGLKQQQVVASRSGGQKPGSRCQQAKLPSKTPGTVLPCPPHPHVSLPWFPSSLGISWLVSTSLQPPSPSSRRWRHVSVYLCLFSSYDDAGLTGGRPSRLQHDLILTWFHLQDPRSSEVTFPGSRA